MIALEYTIKHFWEKNALFIEVPSDRHGFPRLVATHYLQATETHDDLADWGFYRRVANQANWLVSSLNNDTDNELIYRNNLIDSEELRYMGEWSDGREVKLYAPGKMLSTAIDLIIAKTGLVLDQTVLVNA